MTALFADGLPIGGGWSWLGAGLGAMLAAGGLLFFVGLPVNRRPGLEARLAPYLRDTARPSRLLAVRGDTGGPGLLLTQQPLDAPTEIVDHGPQDQQQSRTAGVTADGK